MTLYVERLLDGGLELGAPLDETHLHGFASLPLGCLPLDSVIANLMTREAAHFDRTPYAEKRSLERQSDNVLRTTHAATDLNRERKLAIGHVPVAEVDSAEDERRTLEIERALETHRLELASIAKQLAAIAKQMPEGLHDVGAVVHDLCSKVIDEVSAEYPLGNAATALRSTGNALHQQWRGFAESVEAEERSVLALEHVLVDLDSDESLLAEFEERAAEQGLWPEDLNILWRCVKLGPALLEPRSQTVDQVKLRQFLQLLAAFDGRGRRGFDSRKLNLGASVSRAGKERK